MQMTIKDPAAPATPPQKKFAVDLLQSRDLLKDPSIFDAVNAMDEAEFAAWVERAIAKVDTLTKGQASELIGRLKPLPKKAGAQPQRKASTPEEDLQTVVQFLRKLQSDGKLDSFGVSLLQQYERKGSLSPKQVASVIRLNNLGGSPNAAAPELVRPEVPPGRYAVEVGGDWVLVNEWEGRNGQRRLYVARGAEDGHRITGASEIAILEAVAVDPGKAAREFGHRTGRCSRCRAKLDVNLTREIGVGPTCMKHWYDDATRLQILRSARADLRARGIDPAEKLDSLALEAIA